MKLWAALVEERERLGRGYRVLHNHMLTSFKFWEKSEYTFVNPFGRPLNLTELKASDLYGFLYGDGSDEPTGPGRLLSPSKLAVIDAFFKAKYPLYAPSFKTSDELTALAQIFRQFFSKPADTIFSDIGAETFSGIYVIDAPSLKKRFDGVGSGEIDPTAVHIPVFVLQYLENRNHLVVHRVLYPPNAAYFVEGGGLAVAFKRAVDIYVDQFHEQKTQTFIFGGAGFPVFDAQDELGIKLICILRDQATYAPDINYIRFGKTAESTEKAAIAPADILSDELTYLKLSIFLEYIECYNEDINSINQKSYSLISNLNLEYSMGFLKEVQYFCKNGVGVV